MDLEFATSLKRELQSIFAIRTRGVMPGGLAFGVAAPAAGTDYRIAVRTPSEEDFPEDARRLVEQMTAGEVDVRFVGRVRAIGAHALSVARGVAVGASIGHHLGNPGTLGFFARRDADGTIGFVSSNHVIAAEDRGVDGDEIFHPAPADHGGRSLGPVGRLVGGYPRLDQPEPVVDCAFARLANGTPYDVSSPDAEYRIVATDVPPFAEREVYKIGRTTGLTTGRITAFDLDTEIVYSHERIWFRKQIEIDSATDSSFAVGGDSGSLVFTRSGHPVALVCAASAAGGTKNHGLTYANPIRPVLDALGVTLIV